MQVLQSRHRSSARMLNDERNFAHKSARSTIDRLGIQAYRQSLIREAEKKPLWPPIIKRKSSKAQACATTARPATAQSRVSQADRSSPVTASRPPPSPAD